MWVIIVAAGVGSRMKTDMPKQFIELCGKPVLMHSIMAFVDAIENLKVAVALCPSHIDIWLKLCKKHDFTQPHKIVEGGSTRFHSVKNALTLLPEDGFVAIHDAVRPLVNRHTIINCFDDATKHGCAVPVIPAVDSVRQIAGQSNRMLDRSELRLVQTPQIFKIDLLKKAYRQEYQTSFTDCASVFESAGNKIHLSTGNIDNIKITTSRDLAVAEALLRMSQASLTDLNS